MQSKRNSQRAGVAGEARGNVFVSGLNDGVQPAMGHEEEASHE